MIFLVFILFTWVIILVARNISELEGSFLEKVLPDELVTKLIEEAKEENKFDFQDNATTIEIDKTFRIRETGIFLFPYYIKEKYSLIGYVTLFSKDNKTIKNLFYEERKRFKQQEREETLNRLKLKTHKHK